MKIDSVIKNNKEWIDRTWEKVDKKLSRVSVKSRNKLPYTTVNGVHDDKFVGDAASWTNGFWGGMMWLMYERTGNEDYKLTALRSEELMDTAMKNFKSFHHDVGFMWHILAGANYRLTGNIEAYNKNLYMAATLFSRYNINGGFIRAWNDEGTENWSIIDCLMNIPLLYWASEEIGDERFKNVAVKHADMALRDHIRKDGSVNHIVEHNPDTGAVVKIHAGQGFSETSCWARGLAWAIYGMTLSYIHTKEERYLEGAVRTSEYFIKNIEKFNYLTPIDMCVTEPLYHDSTAGVIIACGLLELIKYVPDDDAKRYAQTAMNLLKATDEHFCNYSDDEDSIVQCGTERYPHYSTNGLEIPIIYGDFYFVEALTKLKGSEFLIW